MLKQRNLKLSAAFLLLIIIASLQMSCGVYSFTGASVEGKNINFHTFENRARNVMPSLNATLTDKIRNRILSQTGLAPTSSDEADYDLSGTIVGYDVTVTGIQNTQTASQNRLTISIQVDFVNRKNPKASYKQSFSRFADFAATQALQNVENQLIDEIGRQLADDIFNKAFVNW
ncbi:MAG: hypothetical protein IT256_08100 [Chitinophagaceae bacterium]|nr:hypothetical protein [Chitinophagaceae bacterium]